MAGNLTTRITISADDKASAPLRNVAKSAQSLCDQLEAMNKRLGGLKFLLGFGAGGLDLGGAVKDIALAAARYDMLGVAMEQAGANAGYTAQQMHAIEASLVTSGIALDKSRESVIRLAAANVDLSKSAELARMAQNLGVAANIDSSEAFDRLTGALISGNTQSLQSLGLFINFQKEYDKAAKAMGRNAASLDESEKLQIRVNAGLEAGAGYAGLYEISMTKAGKQLDSFTRHWANFQALAGQVTLGALSAGIFGINESLESVNKRLMEMQESGELAAISERIGGAFRAVAGNIDVAALALGSWLVLSRTANTATAQRVAALSAEHGIMATLKAEITGATAMLGQDTAAYIANTQAVIANNQARLAAINAGIGAKQSVIAKISTAEYATDIAAIQHRKILERELKVLQAERIVVTRQLEVAERSLTRATAQQNAALATVGRAAVGVKARLGGLINAMGGPWVLGITLATTAIYAMFTSMDRGVNIAEKYGDAILATSGDADAAAAAVKRLEARISAMSQAQLTASLKMAEEDMRKAARRVEAFNKGIIELDSGIGDMTVDLDGAIFPLHEAISAFIAGDESLAKFSDSMHEAYTQGLINRTELDKVIKAAQEFDGTREAARRLAAALDEIKDAAQGGSGAVKDLGNSLEGVDFKALVANAKFDIDKLGLSDRDRSVVENLLRNKVLEQGNINIAGAGFAVGGVAPEAEARVRELVSWYETLFDTQAAITRQKELEREAEARANEEKKKMEKYAEVRLDFEKDYLAVVIGGEEAQMEAIRDRVKVYAEAGVDMVRLAEWQAQMELQHSRKAASGMIRALKSYADEATNAGKQMENVFSSAMSNLEDAFTTFITDGKLSFSNFIDSLLADLARLTVQQSVTGPLASALGDILGNMFSGGGAGSSASAGSGYSGSGLGGLDGSLGGLFDTSAKGSVKSGPGISAYSNSIVTQPTLFPFARGVGLMGEAGAEAIMPLTRTRSGNLGVEADVSGGGVNINIINHMGSEAEVSIQEAPSANGGFDLDVIIERKVKSGISSGRYDSAMTGRFRGLSTRVGGR